MPSLEDNRKIWSTYDWSQRGEEWSVGWGSTSLFWWSGLLPRLRPFLPCRRLVEIAPGHGRYTRFLADQAEEIRAVDLDEGCVEEFRKRFEGRPEITIEVTDGKTLVGVPDQWADLVFSFDSLIHADAEVMRAYIGEISRVLAPDGVAWIHHSNLAEIEGDASESPLRRVHLRDPSVSGALVEGWAREVNLHVGLQEILPWGDDTSGDCISILVRPEGRFGAVEARWRNLRFRAWGAFLNNVRQTFHDPFEELSSRLDHSTEGA